MKLFKTAVPVFFMIVGICCSVRKQTESGRPSTHYDERYRPQFHFSPATHWTNDPNGLVYYDGEYHIFYQYNPYGDTWGHMSWGHAVSKDLMHWEHLPIALSEYGDSVTGDSTMIFSGTVVVDKKNSSGLCKGKDCLVAVYTSHVHAKGQDKRQHQSLAFSNDRGRTWKRFAGNPILDIQRKDFRDPKIFWSEKASHWVMEVVIPDRFKVQFYQSSNLLDWKFMSEFGPLGDTAKIWECPDLYELLVENANQKKWVLSLSGSHPQGSEFVGMQYFIGEFDGTGFTADDSTQLPRYVDYGKDFYAGIIFNNLPAEKNYPVMIGWANNWTYARETPTAPWRGAMSLPRELSLRQTSEGLLLVQEPLAALRTLRKKEIVRPERISGTALEILVDMDLGSALEAGVKVLKSGEEETVIGYTAKTGELFLDRTHSGNTDFHKDFARIDKVKLKPIQGKINLHIFIDHSMIEVFANHGELTFTDNVYPTRVEALVETYSKDGEATFSVKAWTMKSVWR